jgi:hypothetical protein
LQSAFDSFGVFVDILEKKESQMKANNILRTCIDVFLLSSFALACIVFLPKANAAIKFRPDGYVARLEHAIRKFVDETKKGKAIETQLNKAKAKALKAKTAGERKKQNQATRVWHIKLLAQDKREGQAWKQYSSLFGKCKVRLKQVTAAYTKAKRDRKSTRSQLTALANMYKALHGACGPTASATFLRRRRRRGGRRRRRGGRSR